MGMGEPMLNLDHVLGAAALLPDLGITHRRTTVSTVGWLPGLTRFVDEVAGADPPRAVAARSRRRAALAADARQRALSARRRRGRVRALRVAAAAEGLRGVRDARRRQRPRRAGAAAGGACSSPACSRSTSFPYNPTGAFDGSSRKAIEAFKHVLDRAGLPATVRLTRGRDIDAACGQLAAKRLAA